MTGSRVRVVVPGSDANQQYDEPRLAPGAQCAHRPGHRAGHERTRCGTGRVSPDAGSAFEFFGDIHLIGMNPGFRHGLIAGCEQAQQGYYACGFDVDGTLPNVWVKLGWPLLPLTDFAFFTGIDAYWAISHYSAFGTACPAEWIKPPVIW